MTDRKGMKTAEEVAKDFIGIVTQGIKRGVPYDESRDLIIQALAAYAEERVKEETKRNRDILDRMIDKTFKEARAEALEEAMSEAYYRCEDKGGNQENCLCAPCHIWRNIRALKAKP